MNSAAVYRYRRSDLLKRYPQTASSKRTGAEQNRNQALCIMNFHSFSMFDLFDPHPARRIIDDHRDFSKNAAKKNSCRTDRRKLIGLDEDTQNSRSHFQIMVDRKESAAMSVRPESRSGKESQTGYKSVKRSVKSPRKMISAGKLSVMAAVIFLLLTMSLLLRIFMGPETNVRAGIPLSEVQYKVVEINYGDTLWSIAKNNMNPGYTSIKDYISDIKECNQMSSDKLNTGGYLMIPYYEYVRDDTL